MSRPVWPKLDLRGGDVSYLGEGKANLVLRCGNNKIVRVRKASAHIPDLELAKLAEYQAYIVQKFRLEQFIDLPEPRMVDNEELSEVLRDIFRGMRQNERIISPDLHIAFQQPDYTLLADICVEIKPKWPGVRIGESRCVGCCRGNEHCTADLFSHNFDRILQAVRELRTSKHKHLKIHKNPRSELCIPLPPSVTHYWIARILHRSSLLALLRDAFMTLQQDRNFFDSPGQYPPLAHSESEAKAMTFACLADISILLLLSFDGCIPRIRIIDLDAKLYDRLHIYYDYIRSYRIVSDDFRCSKR